MANKLSLVLSGGIRKVMHNFPQQASLFEICHTNGCSTLLSDQHDRLAFFVIVSQKQSGGMLRNSLPQMNKCFILSIQKSPVCGYLSFQLHLDVEQDLIIQCLTLNAFTQLHKCRLPHQNNAIVLLQLHAISQLCFMKSFFQRCSL